MEKMMAGELLDEIVDELTSHDRRQQLIAFNK
jgi:protein subunit release factor A